MYWCVFWLRMMRSKIDARPKLIEAAIQKDNALYASDIVLVETVWVLSRSYQFTRQEIGGVLRKLLTARHLVFSAPDQSCSRIGCL